MLTLSLENMIDQEIIKNHQEAIHEFKKVDDELKICIESFYTDLGSANNWGSNAPAEFVNCVVKEHEREKTIINEHITEHKCDICQYKYTTDTNKYC